MALKVIAHRKRPAPSRAKKAGKKQRRRRHYKMPPLEEYYYELRFDNDIGEDMVKVNYKLHLDSIDRYEMLEEFGASDDPAVAEARDQSTGEIVAVKRVRPSEGDDGAASLCAAVREASCLAACLGHPSVQQIRGMAADDKTGDLFIVTEQLLLGDNGGGAGTLRSRLTRPFSEDQTRALMRQLLHAAEAMHGAGVTHRDINPDNILVSAGGTLKICGFRCAVMPTERFIGESHPPMGTLRYCSPHQLNGIHCYCPAEDIWALGCVMAELLAGEPLFTADNHEDLIDETLDLSDDLDQFGAEAEAFHGALEEVSLAGRELLAGLLALDTSERPTAADALKHRWFAENDVVKAKSRVVRAYTQR